MIRGTGSSHPKQRGYTPAQAKVRVPSRVVSTANLADDFYRANEYKRIHSRPEEQFELYTSPEDLQQFDDPAVYGFIRLNDDAKCFYRTLFRDANRRIAGEHVPPSGLMPKNINSPSAPNINIVNLDFTNHPEKMFTGFRYGSNYSKMKFDIDSPMCYDTEIVDKFPEIINNVPPAKDPPADYLSTSVLPDMIRAGETKWDTRRRLYWGKRHYGTGCEDGTCNF